MRVEPDPFVDQHPLRALEDHGPARPSAARATRVDHRDPAATAHRGLDPPVDHRPVLQHRRSTSAAGSPDSAPMTPASASRFSSCDARRLLPGGARRRADRPRGSPPGPGERVGDRLPGAHPAAPVPARAAAELPDPVGGLVEGRDHERTLAHDSPDRARRARPSRRAARPPPPSAVGCTTVMPERCVRTPGTNDPAPICAKVWCRPSGATTLCPACAPPLKRTTRVAPSAAPASRSRAPCPRRRSPGHHQRARGLIARPPYQRRARSAAPSPRPASLAARPAAGALRPCQASPRRA